MLIFNIALMLVTASHLLALLAKDYHGGVLMVSHVDDDDVHNDDDEHSEDDDDIDDDEKESRQTQRKFSDWLITSRALTRNLLTWRLV